MPELPEVETVARELRSTIINSEIMDIEALWHKSFQDMCDIELPGQKIVGIDRLGKYLLIKLSASTLVAHLRMTGQFLFFENEEKAVIENHTRIIFRFTNRSVLHFKDTRKFGRVYHVSDAHEIISHIGPDALDERVTVDYFKNILKLSKMNIKALLLSQKFVSGLGNIYIDEALFNAGINPARISETISTKKGAQLYKSIQLILNKSIENMGSTISDYRDPSGNKGNNQNYFYVYGRTGLPCKKCNTLIKKVKLAGRGTHFCPGCQKN